MPCLLVLFALGLLLLSLSLRPIALQVTGFVVAQSIALVLTMYGVIALPERAVWPIVVVSIGYVVVENLVTRRLTPWRLILILVIGLFHGSQIAGTLRALGALPARLLSATLSFNAGVVGGELSALAAAFFLVAAATRRSTAALGRSSARG